MTAGSLAGCGDSDRPKDASPIVSPDSEAGRKAMAESSKFLELRKQQEANSRKRPRVHITEG
ncbi:hypothetical protein P12x_004330 [Tundrisphaera lichenicola]|uniref:hypothetical protein n=1 Tax=Tundrisphaera lichenicola TaxID=2029860 RepID=UPI003EBACB37